MNEERLLCKGRLVECERKLDSLNEQAQGVCVAIRARLNPLLEANPEKWDTANVLENARRLNDVVGEMRKLRTQIDKLNEALGNE